MRGDETSSDRPARRCLAALTRDDGARSRASVGRSWRAGAKADKPEQAKLKPEAKPKGSGVG